MPGSRQGTATLHRSIPVSVATATATVCHAVTGGTFDPTLCQQECGRKLTCGRHRCTTVCCGHRNDETTESHICMRVCGKMLRCNKHTCDQLCHKGHCAPCLQSIFEDVACECGKTILEPPVQCGTPRPECILGLGLISIRTPRRFMRERT